MADSSGHHPDLASLTVAVLSLSGDAVLARRVAELEHQGCRVVAIPEHEGRGPVPYLRMRALRDATTPFVAFLEDTATVAPTWAAAAVAALADARIGAISGPVTIAPALPPRYRALGLTEYAAFQAGRQTVTAARDDAARVHGLGFAVRRAAVLDLYRPDEPGLIEGEIADRLHRAGLRLGYVPDMATTYDQPHEQGARLGTRFQHGRLYAATRVSQKGLANRIAYALVACLLPVILTQRSLAGRPLELRGSFGTVGWVFVMHSAWALGEFTGYLFGASADSLKSWS